MKAMLFAAGLGTRLKPFTENNPKALAVVNGITLLERNIEYLKNYGIKQFVINTHHFGNKIIDFLEAKNYLDVSFEISDEYEMLLETGGGLVKAKKFLDKEPFLVMNVDILTDLNIQKLIEFHTNNNALISLAVSNRESSRKLLFDKDMRLFGWKNLNTKETICKSTKTLHPFAFSGVHMIDPKVFELMPKQGKFSIMKTYMEIMNEHKIVGFDHTGGKLIDVGKPESIAIAESYFK